MAKKPDRGCQIIRKMSSYRPFRRIVRDFYLFAWLLVLSQLNACAQKNLRSYPIEMIFSSKQTNSYSGPISPDTLEELEFLNESFIGDLVLVKNSLAIVLQGVDTYPGRREQPETLIKRVFVHQSGKWKDLGKLPSNTFSLKQETNLRLSALRFQDESISYLFSPEDEWKLTDVELKFDINDRSQLIINLSKSDTSPATQIQLTLEGLFQESKGESKKYFLSELARSNFMLSMDATWSEQVYQSSRQWKAELKKNSLEFKLLFSRPTILAELYGSDWSLIEVSAFRKVPRLIGESLKLEFNDSLLLKAYPGERLALPKDHSYRLISGKQTSDSIRLDDQERLLELDSKAAKLDLKEEQLEQIRGLRIQVAAIKGSLLLADTKLHEAKSFSFSSQEFSELEFLAGSYRLSFHSDYAEICSELLQVKNRRLISECLSSGKNWRQLAEKHLKTANKLAWQAIETSSKKKLTLTNRETLILENANSNEESLASSLTLMEAKQLSTSMSFAASCPTEDLSEYLAMASALKIRKFYIFHCPDLKDILSSLDLFQADREMDTISLSAQASSVSLGCIPGASRSCEDSDSIGFSAALDQLKLKLLDNDTLKITAQAVSIPGTKLGVRVWMIGLRPRLAHESFISGEQIDIELAVAAQDLHLRLEIFNAADDKSQKPFASSNYLSIDKLRRSHK